MKRRVFDSQSVGDTKDIAYQIASGLKKGDIICLYGDLGSGKTTFVKGLTKRLKIEEDVVNSPTFVLMNVYEGKLPVYHFDLYRLEDIGEIAAIGYEEFLYGDGVAVVEWADRLKTMKPKEFLSVELKHKGEDKRQIVLSSLTSRYSSLIEKLKEKGR